jgi:SAM-dependent methyltransferase
MPTDKELYDYYQGFKFNLDLSKLSLIENSGVPKLLSEYGKGGSKFLDFGGGGGFFCRIFENMKLGVATYVDLDGQACEFAKVELGLSNIFHGDLNQFQQANREEKYDLIICRHVVEHQTDPVQMIEKLCNLLDEGGTLILSCPNGASKEGLIFPKYWLKFLYPAKVSNEWGKWKSIYFSLSKRFAWGMDPPRHLWALTPSGLRHSLESRDDFFVNVFSKSYVDRTYSPYVVRNGLFQKIMYPVVEFLFSKYFDGMHLVALVTKKKAHDNEEKFNGKQS